ncbi:MAG: hypothetical protein HY738_04735, partial [Bacteroidia bacterium]|nr:hypothetical protein [Bacteroidia bacterium]
EKNKRLLESDIQVKKFKEIQKAIEYIDTSYFEYRTEFKKHILKINVAFQRGSSNIKDIPPATQKELQKAGEVIRDFIEDAYNKMGLKYLLIIEGQASNDLYPKNYELSYERALTLVKFWSKSKIYFNKDYCDVIISGSGKAGSLRMLPDDANNKLNQRFLIHIIPKIGDLK